MSSVDANEPEPPPSSELDAIALDRAGRRKRMIVGAAALVVLAGGGAALMLHAEDAKATARVNAAWSALAKCALGPDLEPGESASRRFRALQLGGMTLPEPQRAADGGQSWPGRCGVHGHSLKEALHDAGREAGPEGLAGQAEALAKRLKDNDAFSADLSALVENVWAAARAEKVTLAAAPDVAGPPLPAQALTIDALAKVEPVAASSFALKNVSTDLHPGGVLRVLVDQAGVPKSPFVCTFGKGDAPARCAGLPASIAATHQGLRLLATADDDAAPLVFAGDRGAAGVFRADGGELVTSMYSYGGQSTSDGASAVLGWNEEKRELRLVRKAKGGSPIELNWKPEFDINNFFYSSQLLGDELVLRGVTKKAERRLFVQHVERSGPLGAPVDVGELPEPGLVTGGADEPPHITGCRTAQALAVRVKGYDNDFLALRIGGAWSRPVSPELTGGALSCRGAEATVTRLELAGADTPWKTTIRQARCTSAGCQTAVARVEKFLGNQLQLAPREGNVDAVELDGKLLVVWAAGERGGVRMRFASADKIESAPDAVLFDDLVKEGKVQSLSTLFDLRLFSREGYAILLLGTVSGVHALRIDPTGKVSPAKIDWG